LGGRARRWETFAHGIGSCDTIVEREKGGESKMRGGS